ncbi:MAG: hypothetical protein N3C63_00640 [Rhodocyclaceae bacterium]|nr:hypothetical protein [Rhodocyclaceae bacterium]
MSLLMEALRKAEEQKRQQAKEGAGSIIAPAKETQPNGAAATAAGAAADWLELVPEEPPASARPAPAKPAARPGHHPLPELPSRLEELDEQFMVHAASPASKPKPAPAAAPKPAEPPAASSSAEAERARTFFAAKAQPREQRRHFALAMAALALVGALGIGGWLWWQLQPRGGLASKVALAPAPPPAPVSPPASGASPAGPPSAAPAPSSAAAPPAVPPAPTLTSPAAAETAASKPSVIAQPEAPRPVPPREEVRSAAPEPPIRVSRGVAKTNPLLEEAWQAFQRGEHDLARAAWQKVLSSEPLHTHALHGLAAIAQREGRHELAADYYLRALVVDPKDGLALAGLLALKPPADPLAMESRLKTLLAEQPESPYLNFALGNLYARAARWAEAQQAFFRAHVADPAHPDYLFNLAVSLDQLHQSRLAVEYYQRALAAAASHPASFDAAAVAARLRALHAGE